MNIRVAVLPFCLLTGFSQIGFSSDIPASGKQVELHWSELGAFLSDGDVKLVLPDGVFVQGRTLAVRPAELVLDVSKSSDKKAYPKGQTAIPRTAIRTISYTRTKGVANRLVLTMGGVFGGMGLGTLYALAHEDSTANVAQRASILALPVGLGVAGYYGGRSADRKTTLIKILPD